MEELIPLEIAVLWFLRMKNEGSWKKLFGVMGGSQTLQYTAGGIQYGNPPTTSPGSIKNSSAGNKAESAIQKIIKGWNDFSLPIPAALNKIFNLHIPGI